MNANANTYDSRKAKRQLAISRFAVYVILVFLSILCLFSF